jgi:cytochrome c-type biogenesis protein CcmH/NrfG
MRLIRRDKRIRFHGAMHETFWPDIDRLRRERAGRTGASRLALDHIGYDGDQSHKFDRNLRLLTKQIAADPSRSYLHWHLGTVHLALGRPDAAEAAWAEGMRLVRARSHRVPDDAQCFVETIKLRWSRGQDVAGLLDEAESIQPGNWLLLWLRAKTLAAAGRHEAAIALFERLAAVDADSLVDAVAYDARIFGAWACAEIGHSAFRLGQFARSESWYGRAEQLQPSNREFRVKRMLARARRGP